MDAVWRVQLGAQPVGVLKIVDVLYIYISKYSTISIILYIGIRNYEITTPLRNYYGNYDVVESIVIS